MIVTLPTSRLVLRPVTADDAPLVIAWRNTVRGHFFSGAAVTPEGHAAFVASLAPDDFVWIAETAADGIPVGQIAITASTGEFGRYLVAPNVPGRGYGMEMGWLALLAGYERLHLPLIWGECVAGNAIAINSHIALGFTVALAPRPLHAGGVYIEYPRARWEAEREERWHRLQSRWAEGRAA